MKPYRRNRRPGNRAMTADQSARIDAIKRIGCVACIQLGYVWEDNADEAEIPSLPGYWVSTDGVVVTRKTGKGTHGIRQMRASETPSGYLRIQFRVEGRPINRFVHAVVAETFIGPRAEGMQINHKDGNKHHNCVGNLEYATRRQNMDHAVKMKLTMRNHARGESHYSAKYTERQVIAVRRKYAALPRTNGRPPYGSVMRLAEEAGMPVSTVEKIVSRTTWASV